MTYELPKLDRVNDPIARSVFSRKDDNGETVEIVIAIGRPELLGAYPGWFCPVSIDGHTSGVIPIVGILPIDALVNAMALVSKFIKRENAIPLRPL